MNISDITKQIKAKLKEFGHEVKHTQCQEILAIAHGFKNSHVMRNKNQQSSLDATLDVIMQPKALIVSMGATTTNEYDCEELEFALIKLCSEDLRKIKDSYELIEKGVLKTFTVELNKKTILKKVELESFEDEDKVRDEGYILEYNFQYEIDNNFDKRDSSFWLEVCADGLILKAEHVTKHYNTYYSSYGIPLNEF